MGVVDERRNRTRFRIRLPFVLKNNGQEVQGTTRNISLLGIASYTHQPIEPARPVICLLELPHRPANPVCARGTVIRCAPAAESHPDGSFETGVFFKEFDGEGETILSKYLHRILQREETAIRAGYKAFRKKIAARKRRKRYEELRKKKKRSERLKRKRQKLARSRRAAGGLSGAATQGSPRGTSASRDQS